MLAEELYWIPLLPFLGFLVNGLLGGRLGPRFVSWVGCLFPMLACALAAGIFRELLLAGDGAFFRQVLAVWIDVRSMSGPDGVPLLPALSAPWALHFDALSGVMCLVVTGVGSLIHLYATGYMKGDPGYARFFAYLNLFTAFMLLLVLGDNLLLVFIGWEGVGLCSYLLIGFWYHDSDNAAAGNKAFIVNRIGDFGVLLAMFLLLLGFGTLDLSAIAAKAADAQWLATLRADSDAALGLGGGALLVAITLLLFLGCTGKSAQIPLYTWLPDAMAGPTPVSALIHAATMVTSGVYLACRLHPLFTAAPETLAVITGIGATTAILAALIAISQNDIKRVLAYSTVSQLGYMFFAVGLGAYSAALFHLVTHAFFKALLFLGSGSVIHALHHEQDMRRMGGLWRKLPWTYATFLVGAAALAGVPLLAGFVSKDEILFAGYAHDATRIFWVMAWITAGLTAFYMVRLVALTFWGASRVDPAVERRIHEPDGWMPVVLGVLALLSATGGLINWPEFLFHGGAWLTRFTGLPHGPHSAPEPSHAEEWASMGLSVAIAGAGLIGAWFLYQHGRGLLNAWLESAPGRVLTSLSRNKFWVDEIYDSLVVRPYRWLAAGLFWTIDRFLIDTVLVRGTAELTKLLAAFSSRIQSGFAPQYLATYSLGALALLFIVLFKLREAG